MLLWISVVGFHGLIQMLVDGPAGKIVVDPNCTIRLSTLTNWIDLLMDAVNWAANYRIGWSPTFAGNQGFSRRRQRG